jgi:hypothetical protein
VADLADAITKGITGREPVSEDSSLSEILAELVAATGSGKGAAGALGISPTTFYRWQNYANNAERGIRQAPKVGKRTIVAAARRAALPPIQERRIRKGEVKLAINGMVAMSKDVRNRTVKVGQYITDRKMGNVIGAWLAGDDARAERLLYRHIDQHYADGMEFDTIEWAEFQS